MNQLSTHHGGPLGPDTGEGGPAKRRRVRRGMTLFEIMFAVLIIFLLMVLLIGAVRMVTGSAQEATHRAAALSLKQGISLFQTEFGFLPPLVRDVDHGFQTGSTSVGTNPPIENRGGTLTIITFSRGVPSHLQFLRHWSDTWPPGDGDADLRFSMYSLPYYLIGTLDDPRRPAVSDSPPIDGSKGPGFRKPRPDGQFEFAGRRYDPFFDAGTGSTSLYIADAAGGRVELRDRNGVAIRYYRWEAADPAALNQNSTLRERSNIPFMVIQWLPDEPSDRRFDKTPAEASPAEMSASYAIVGAGANGLFGDEAVLPQGHPQRLEWVAMGRRLGITIGSAPTDVEKRRVIEAAMADNVVEVGR